VLMRWQLSERFLGDGHMYSSSRRRWKRGRIVNACLV